MGRLQTRQRERSRGEPNADRIPSNRIAANSSDATFKILSNTRRRYAIEYLVQSSDDTVRLRDLAEQIAAWENDVSPHEVTYKQRKRVYTSLYQTHLPKMDRTGVVEYERSSGLVRPTTDVTELYAYMESTATKSQQWRRFGLPLSALCVVLVAAAGLGVVPYGGGYGYELAFAVSMIFLLVSMIQYIDVRVADFPQ